MRILSMIITVFPGTVLANTFDRPVPQAQSATAEFWFALASLALVAALWAVHRLVRRS
ncbi:protein NnrT [Thalassovita taeanensis]|uniref:Protein NnrT n=1 Tax=Thalassovita taeanensis TaxID=657014 RepID=A0A1H9GDL1_9RHOB|nr:protein NnrT [Thalassovita taeanensis]SEQ48166.1 hypothetical protein SAMN04488092_107136 [Thalassovita taeanensis]